jgi:hypothetical protein
MNKKGVAVLPAILVMGVVIIGLALTGILVVRLINQSTFGIRLAAETGAAAQAAVDDANLRLLQGNLTVTKSCPGFVSNPNYSFTEIGRTTVDVFVCKTVCGLDVCQYEVRADAKALFVKRRLKAVLDADPLTKQIKVSSIKLEEF